MLDATPALAPERAELLDLLRSLSPDDWDRPTECPAWTVKGIALHILGDDLSLLSRQRDESTDGITLYGKHHEGTGLAFRDMLDAFNEQWVTAAEFLSTRQLVQLLELVGEWSDDFYCHVGVETVAREPVGFFADLEPSAYWKVIAREYAERVIHQSQIRRALGAPDVHGEAVTWMARVVVHALALWLRDYEVPTGSTITSDWGVAGSWTWRRQADGWSVEEGATDTPSSRVSVAPDRVVALLTRGVSLAEVNAILTYGGADADLARNGLAIAAPLLANP